MPLGVHNSIAGGIPLSIDRAVALGCDTMQIFGRNPRAWAFKPVPGAEAGLFKAKREQAGIAPVVIHTTYLINLCAPDTLIYEKSIDLFENELKTAEALGAEYLVTHLGSPGELGAEFALRRIKEAFRDVAASGLGKKTRVLLENTAGGGYGFGSHLPDIGEIMDGAASIGLDTGLCFDTCHAFAAGYPLKTMDDADALIKMIAKEVGLKNLRVVHLNDSKGELGSNLDRHEHIGKGKIGMDGMRAFLTHPGIFQVPKILETPKKTEEDDPMNLSTVRGMLKGGPRK